MAYHRKEIRERDWQDEVEINKEEMKRAERTWIEIRGHLRTKRLTEKSREIADLLETVVQEVREA
jgi:hypothetical protein